MIKRGLDELAGMGHPDSDPKLLGKQINVMLTPNPVNKRKPKFHHEPDAELPEDDGPDTESADEQDDKAT